MKNILSFLLLLVLATSCVHQKETPPVKQKPNIVIFIADDAGWRDSGAYGNPYIHTPTIDSLARSGMRFTNFYLTTSSCSPSRASIMTGLYPHNTGAHELHMPLPLEKVVFPGLLQDAGYYTAAAGKWHLGPKRSEFDSIYGPLDDSGAGNWSRAIENRPKDKPFFMWFAARDPHRPYKDDQIQQVHNAQEVVVPPYLPDNMETRIDLKYYYDEMARLDRNMGRIISQLNSQGELDNTLVIYMSDNGMPFPRAKTRLYASGIKSPFIAVWPGKIPAGVVNESLLSAVDIAPSLAEIAGAKSSEEFIGHSFLSLLLGQTKDVREYAFSEHNWHDFRASERAVADEEFMLIRNYYPELSATPPADAVNSSTYQGMVRLYQMDSLEAQFKDSFMKPRSEYEFFDLRNDPYQMTNLIMNEDYADKIHQMKQVLMNWQRDYADTIAGKSRPDRFDRITGDRID